MAAQKTAFMETEHPLARRIWKMLEKEIPPDYVKETTWVPDTWCQKSTTEAVQLRNLGNQSHRSKNYDEAIVYYSKSVATAPADSEELALAYGNRSAILQYKKEYEWCLLDLNRALDGPLPQSTRQTLLQRKAMVWDKLQEQNVLRPKLREGIASIKRSNQERANLSACARNLGYISKVDIDDVDLVIDHSAIDDPIWNIEFDNTVLENVSPKIELKYDEKLGPHLVAADDIEPGEDLCIDDLHSVSVLRHHKQKYCNYCQIQCEALIPCPHCTWEMYCSAGCREKAYDSYHRIECKMLPLWNLPSTDSEEIRLHVSRTFLRVTKQGSELANLMNNPAVCKALDGKLNRPDIPFTSENYSILMNVVSRRRNSNYKHATWHQKVTRETLAIFARLRYLKFFGNEDSETQSSGNTLSAVEYFGILLLVHQVSLMGCQTVLVSGVSVGSLGDPIEFKHDALGYGFSQWRCFTEHSCDPNVDMIINRRRIHVHSLRSIKAGEPITFTYANKFTLTPRIARQNELKDIGCQECTCNACVEDWPRVVEISKSGDKYRIRDKKIVAKIEKMRKWLGRINNSTVAKEDLEKALELSKILSQYVKGPSFTRYHCERLIGRCMVLKGSLHVDPKYIAALAGDLV